MYSMYEVLYTLTNVLNALDYDLCTVLSFWTGGTRFAATRWSFASRSTRGFTCNASLPPLHFVYNVIKTFYSGIQRTVTQQVHSFRYIQCDRRASKAYWSSCCIPYQMSRKRDTAAAEPINRFQSKCKIIQNPGRNRSQLPHISPRIAKRFVKLFEENIPHFYLSRRRSFAVRHVKCSTGHSFQFHIVGVSRKKKQSLHC